MSRDAQRIIVVVIADGAPVIARDGSEYVGATSPDGDASELPQLRELATRIVEALHGRHEPGAERMAFGDVELDMSIREVRRAGRPVGLTPREYGILAELARHRGEPVTYRRLLEVVWGPQYTREVHYLRVYMSSLRRKLESDRGSPRYLLTQGGVGYMLAA